MKKKILVISVLTFLLFVGSIGLFPKDTYAQFGIGLIIGEPTGLSLKYKMGNFSIDGALAYSFVDKGYLYIHSTFLVDIPVIPVDGFMLYSGAGGRVRIWDKNDYGIGDEYHQSGFDLAIRIPIGVEYIFTQVPIGISLEISFNVGLFPSTNFDLGGALIFRYYL